MTSPRIAIIGAGPSGLLLARLLSLSPSPIPLNVQIFERDASPSTRTQGGTLDLRSGLPALKAAGLEEKFFEHARWEGSALGICDKRGKWLLKVGGGEGKGGNPEIDREALRLVSFFTFEGGEERGGWKGTDGEYGTWNELAT